MLTAVLMALAAIPGAWGAALGQTAGPPPNATELARLATRPDPTPPSAAEFRPQPNPPLELPDDAGAPTGHQGVLAAPSVDSKLRSNAPPTNSSATAPGGAPDTAIGAIVAPADVSRDEPSEPGAGPTAELRAPPGAQSPAALAPAQRDLPAGVDGRAFALPQVPSWQVASVAAAAVTISIAVVIHRRMRRG